MTASLAPELYTTADTPTDRRLMHQMQEQDRSPVSTDRNMPRFTLVIGPSPFTMPRGWEYYLTTPFEGLSYIATVLHNAGFPVRIVDVRYALDPLAEVMRQVGEGTDVVGITTFEDNFPWVAELVDLLKAAHPHVPVVLGGSLVTSVPHVFRDHTRADVLVISEGELTILELMESYAKGTWAEDLPRIRGIWHRTADGGMERTPPRGQMLNLDFLPRVRLDLWPQYRHPRGLQPQVITSYSRGCKRDCSFCFRTTPQVSAKSPKKFDEDMRWLRDQYGMNFLFFCDLTFSAETRQTLEMCEVLQPLGYRWTCMTRCADADKERLDAMKGAGCDVILFGVESLGAEALREARKPTTENISIRAMHRTDESGIRFGALLIVGLPGETAESMDHMARWAEEFQHVVRVKYLAAMPGTTVYKRGLEQGLMRSELDHLKWLSIEQCLPEDEFINYNGLPEGVIRQAYRRMYDSYLPGPVMDFNHYPENFLYFHPNPSDGGARNVAYAGRGWRAKWSSAGAFLTPGSERFTLKQVGVPGSVAAGASEVPCGAAGLALEKGLEIDPGNPKKNSVGL